MKTCTKCKTEYVATKEFFPSDKQNRDGLSSWCRACSLEACREYRRRNPDKCRVAARICRQKRPGYYREYRKTIPGRITDMMATIKSRCYRAEDKRYKYYGGKGITLEFTRKELLDWLSKNGIDPRDLVIHRKDSSKNYSLGNIEFLAKNEHDKLHWRIRHEESTV